jgi:methionyl-tRNA formyltransferase
MERPAMPRLKTVFMGTAELACASLRALLREDFIQIATVVTQPDRPKGRSLKLQGSPVKEIASAEHLPLLQPERARSEDFIAQLRELRPDLIVVAAFGQILPPSVLELPGSGCLNVHASLLPKYRGAAPIQWAILNEEIETGVTIMKMDAGLDTGDMLARAATPIRPEDDARTLHDRLAQLGAELLVRTIPDYVSGKIAPQPQPAAGSSYARKISREDGLLDWSHPARALWNRVRALIPWPGAFTFVGDDDRRRLVKIWSATIDDASDEPGRVLSADKNGILVGCGRQALRISILQLEGGRRLTAQEFLAGQALKAGQRLGS